MRWFRRKKRHQPSMAAVIQIMAEHSRANGQHVTATPGGFKAVDDKGNSVQICGF